MSERKFYVICSDDCLFEGMTKEQILTAIQQAVTNGYVSDPDAAVIGKIKEINKGGAAQVWVGTEAEYNAINPGAISGIVRIGADGKMYFCTDDSTLEGWHDKTVTDAGNKAASVLANKLDKPVLLWENPAPADAFGETTLEIEGLGKYNRFLIEWKKSSSFNYGTDTEHNIPELEAKRFRAFCSDGSGGSWGSWERGFTINRAVDSIAFENGFYAYSGAAYNSKSVMVPLRIYGMNIGGEELDAEDLEIVAFIDSDGSLKVSQV